MSNICYEYLGEGHCIITIKTDCPFIPEEQKVESIQISLSDIQHINNLLTEDVNREFRHKLINDELRRGENDQN